MTTEFSSISKHWIRCHAPGKDEKLTLSFLRELGGFAHLGGDFQLRDPDTHRPFEISIVAGFAVTWWIDAPVNHVKVVDIRPAH